MNRTKWWQSEQAKVKEAISSLCITLSDFLHLHAFPYKFDFKAEKREL